MKKNLFIVFMIIFAFTLSACDRESYDTPREKLDQTLSEEELDDMDKMAEEDPEFAEDYEKAMFEAVIENEMDEDIAIEDEIEKAEANKKAGKNLKGSCDMVADSSICIEYYGSFWSNTVMSSGCKGKFSKKHCPSDMSGGCNTGVGTMADMVSWMYLRGSGEMTARSMSNAQKACDASLASKWIHN